MVNLPLTAAVSLAIAFGLYETTCAYGQQAEVLPSPTFQPATEPGALTLRPRAYHNELAELDDTIELLEAELSTYKRQIHRLGPSSEFRYSSAFGWTLESTRLAAVDAELRLKTLRREKLRRLQEMDAKARSRWNVR